MVRQKVYQQNCISSDENLSIHVININLKVRILALIHPKIYFIIFNNRLYSFVDTSVSIVMLIKHTSAPI